MTGLPLDGLTHPLLNRNLISLERVTLPAVTRNDECRSPVNPLALSFGTLASPLPFRDGGPRSVFLTSTDGRRLFSFCGVDGIDMLRRSARPQLTPGRRADPSHFLESHPTFPLFFL